MYDMTWYMIYDMITDPFQSENYMYVQISPNTYKYNTIQIHFLHNTHCSALHIKYTYWFLYINTNSGLGSVLTAWTQRIKRVCVCVCVCVRARARACACACVRVCM